MLTAIFTGHQLPDFDEALERLLGGSQLVQNGPAHRIGFLSDDGEVYRVVLCHSEAECERVQGIAVNEGLHEFPAGPGYVKVFGKLKPLA